MTPVVDIIATLITAMKPTLDADYLTIAVGGLKLAEIPSIDLYRLYVGTRMKLTYADGDITYGYVTEVNLTDRYVIIDPETPQTHAPTAIEVVLSYHYGTLGEIVDTFVEKTGKATVKRTMFPAICLLQPFTETVTDDGYERAVSLNILFMTGSKQTYKAADRYTNSYKAIIYPMIDVFMQRINHSTYLSPYTPEYDREDRIDLGKAAIDDKRSIQINDFVDVTEISNLKLKIFKT